MALKRMFSPLSLLTLLMAAVPVGFLVAYLLAYAPSYPVVDMQSQIAPIAIAVADGTFQPRMLLRLSNGHRHVPEMIEAAVLTLFTDWNPVYEYLLLVMVVVGNIALTTAIIAKETDLPVGVMAVVMAWILVPLHVGMVWLIPWAMYPQLFFFFLVALTALTWWGATPRAFVVATAAFLITTYTSGVGLPAGPIGLIALWLYGFRKPRYYILYAAIIGAATLWQLNTTSMSLTAAVEVNGHNEFSIPSVTELVRGTLIIMGSSMTARILPAAEWFGGVLLGISVLNVLYLRRGRGPALMVVFIAGTAALTTIARHDWGLYMLLVERYLMQATLGWAGAVILALMVIQQSQRDTRRWAWALATLNALFLTATLFGLIYTSYRLTPTLTEEERDGTITNESILNHKACIEDYLLHRAIGNCMWVHSHPGVLDQLAAHHLSGFANYPVHNELTAQGHSYPSDHVLVDVDSAWAGYHIQDWLLEGVPAANIFHLIPTADIPITETIFPRLPLTLDHISDNPAEIEAFLTDRPDVWVIEPQARPYRSFSAIERNYTLATQLTWGQGFTATGYVPAVERYEAPLLVGRLDLYGWALDSPYHVGACGLVRARTLWQTAQPLDARYRVTLTLADAQGNGVARHEIDFGVPTDTWEPDTDYAARHQINIPCDLAPGQYDLLLGTYIVSPTAEITDQSPLTYLTTLIVD